MISYPFDPQCRLVSNWIKNEQLRAFPSSATRTVVPVHAPFFFKNAVVKKGNLELVEGVHFYYSLKHKSASFANAMDVYGGLTLIDDAINLPLTISYHPLGGAFEATAGQIKLYLDTAPDIWDGSWEALIVNAYYPPVNILFDPEQFVSEPEIIAACQGIESAIKAKDASDTMSYQMYATRIRKLREDLEKSSVAAHIAARGNVHNTAPHHLHALAVDQPAKNTNKLEGHSLAAFTQLLIDGLGNIEELLEGKIKNGEVGVWNSKFLLNGGSLLFGDTTSLYMDEEGIVQNGDNALKLIADSAATRPGTRATLRSGANILGVVSTGNVADDTSLIANDEELVTESTLKAYVNGILNDSGRNLYVESSDNMSWAGAGTMSAPLLAIPNIPSASETGLGIVKVVNEGSHGYPAPGFGGTNFYMMHRGDNRYLQFRNGADDLEYDVFLTEVTVDPFTVKPTADRFRPKKLPITAKPVTIRHGNEDCVWIDTTDGPFIMLTGGSKDYDTWRCLKITNTDMNLGYYGYPQLLNGKVYIVYSIMTNNVTEVALFEAPVTAANTLTFTRRTLTGTNFSGTAQNGESFKLFDVIRTNVPTAKALMINLDGYYFHYNYSHERDQLVQQREGNKVRVCHVGNMYLGGPTSGQFARQPTSYVLDLVAGTIIPDNPEIYPITISQAGGYSVTNPRTVIGGNVGNYTNCGCYINGVMFGHDTYAALVPPVLRAVVPNGMTAFESLRSINQHWTVLGAARSTGQYASPVQSRPRSPKPMPNNQMIVECATVGSVLFTYDPFGSYGPTVKGYGPTNDRKIIPSSLSAELGKLCWIFDGDNITHNGGWLSGGALSSWTTYESGELGGQITMTQAYYNTLLQQALSKYASDVTPTSPEPLSVAVLSLMIHRRPGVPMLGMLQVARVTSPVTGRRSTRVYVFKITTNRLSGEISGITLGQLLTQRETSTTFIGYSPSYRSFGTSSHLYRLNDGNWIVAIGGQYESYVSDGRIPYTFYVFNAKGEKLTEYSGSTNITTGIPPFGTKELGYGLTYIENTAEGTYLDSFGLTSDEVIKTIAGQRAPVRYVVVLSRTDAGDNVAISQLAASNVKTKIESLVPPTRKIQNMDLTQDRVVTKAMLANANKIPNQRDANYPVQQVHINSLSAMALKSHTHIAGDYVLEQATVTAYGSAKLGSLLSLDTDAFSATEIDSLEDVVDVLQARTVSLNQMDATLTIDYEV